MKNRSEKVCNFVEDFNHRFSTSFGWPDGFISADLLKDGFTINIGYSNIDFNNKFECTGGGTYIPMMPMGKEIGEIFDKYLEVE